jgi:hypothetical protein
MAASDLVLQKFGAGDTNTTRRYALTENGAAKDLTSATSVKLYARARGAAALAAITGSIVAPATGGLVDFDHDTIAANEGVYDCDIEVNSASGVISCGDKFKITVRARAASVTY